MTVHELAIRLMRRAEVAVEVGRKLRAEVHALPCSEPARWAVIMGDSVDEYAIDRFLYEEDAHRFAEDVNIALGPIARKRAITVLSSCMNEMAEGLAAIEQS